MRSERKWYEQQMKKKNGKILKQRMKKSILFKKKLRDEKGKTKSIMRKSEKRTKEKAKSLKR